MVSLADVKTFLNITANTWDTFLTDAIQKFVADFNNFTNRKLNYQALTEYYIGNGDSAVYLKNFPSDTITSIKEYNFNGDYAFSTIFTGAGDTLSNSSVVLNESGKLILTKGYAFTKGSIIEIVYSAGYKYDGTGYFLTPHDLQKALIQKTAEYYLNSFQSSAQIFLKKEENVGGAATTGTVYKQVDVGEVLRKYRRINI